MYRTTEAQPSLRKLTTAAAGTGAAGLEVGDPGRRSATRPLVAIVTPVYNGAAYLAQALQSVQAQTYPNIVHVILDNASTDATAAIVAAYAGQRIPLLTARNDTLLPLTDNWDRAFAMIPREAAYAKLLCADDLMRADCIEKFVGLCEAVPTVETVSCHDVHGDKVRRANVPAGVTVVDGREATRAILDRSICWLPFQHLFVRLRPEDFERPFFGTGEYGADPYAVARAALRGQFGYLHEPLVYTRWHARSASNSLARDGATPLYALQVNMMLLTYFKMMLVYGPSVWARPDYDRALRFAVSQLARTHMRWRIRRYGLAADELAASARSLGFPLDAAAYRRAVLGLPHYVMWKRGWRTPIGPTLDEAAFTRAPGREAITGGAPMWSQASNV